MPPGPRRWINSSSKLRICSYRPASTTRASTAGSISWHRSADSKASWSKWPRTRDYDRHRQRAVSLLSDRQTQKAFDVSQADPKTLDRYGRNTFGWSLLMARQLVEAGVNLVQVNLGNNETWDTHGNAFPHLKDFLFPPTDRAVSALLDDFRSGECSTRR